MQYLELANKATTVVKTGAGILSAVVVNNAGSSWTLQIFDGISSSGAAIAGATAFTCPAAGSVLSYNTYFSSGLTIITAGTTAGSITVIYG